MNYDSYTPGQKLSVQHLNGPLLVSAGAGSGKTFTLTQRIAWALLPGSGDNGKPFLNGIDEALVITFTEKAAGEIKDRVRSTLRAEGMADEALKVDGAWVSTIHGMCSRILREHALEVGLDPGFNVLGAVQEEEQRQAAIESVLAHASETGAYERLFSQFETDDVKASLVQLLGEARNLPRGLDAVDTGPEGTPVQDLARAVCDYATHPEEGGTEAFYTAAADLACQMRDYLAGDQSPEDLDALDLGMGALRCKAAASLKAAVLALRQARLVAPYRESTCELVALAREVETAYAGNLARLGQIDLSGLIRKTLEVFDAFPSIAAQYTDRFRLIMVDEFQDTSQLQIDMIERIAGSSRARLCTVGDAQQSIYRFQGADVSVYLAHKESMRAGGATCVQLDDNFRSNADILAFVRAVCGQPGYFPEAFLDLRAAGSGKPYHGNGPRVELVLAQHNHRDKEHPVLTEDARAAEAAHIAQRFAQLKASGHAYSDMVLLLGRMTNAPAYAQALQDAGLPCVVTGGSQYFSSNHVQCCLDLLASLANPFDAACLLTVLTSDVLPVSTDDLLFLSTEDAEPGKRARRRTLAQGLVGHDLPESASPLLHHAHAVLTRAWAKLGTVRPAQLFLETVLDAGWLARLESEGATGSAKAADVLKFVRLVEDAQGEVGYDMARTVREMRSRSLVASEKPGALSVENLDAVRIMTIHSSKGLEFPIVAVADCFESRSRGAKLACYSQGGTLHLSLAASGSKSDLASSDAGPKDACEPSEFRASIIAANDTAEREERKRLFYVAATRASAALIVSMCIPHTSKGYPALAEDLRKGLLPESDAFPEADASLDYGGSQPLLFTRLQPESRLDGHAEPGDGQASEKPMRSLRPDRIAVPVLREYHPPTLVPESARADFFSYSSLAAKKGPEQNHARPTARVGAPRGDDAQEDSSAFAPAAADADKATDFGSALHRACEWLALQDVEPDPDAVEAALDRAAREFGVSDHNRLRSAFKRWQSCETRSWTASFNTIQPELPFVVEKDGGILEGEIDLFCASGTCAGIVDYKTGGHAAETPNQLHEKHLLQAQCYAYAAQQAGYDQVELRFVRVEQEDTEKPGQPQVVVYRFEGGQEV